MLDILQNIDVNILVNVEDNDNIVELKYYWAHSNDVIDSVTWNTKNYGTFTDLKMVA